MADYLVREEDGTSHILTETSDSLLLEESSPQLRSASFTADAQISVSSSVTPPLGESTWRVGTITVPAATGTMSVTGLGGTPKAVFFYGTNWLTEDTAVTSDGLGLFRGMAAPQWDDASLIQSGASVVTTPAGNAHLQQNHAIAMLDTSGNVVGLYAADVTSLDADGFSLNWLTVTAGGYQVVYVALMGPVSVGARIGMYDSSVIDLGWKAGSSLLHGAWFATVVTGADRTQEFYGSAAYPGLNDAGWEGAGVTLFCFPTSISAQYNNELDNASPHIRVAGGGHFTGPFLVTANIVAHPTGSPAAGNNFNIGGDSQDGGMVVAWNDEDSRTRSNTPSASQGGTVTQTGIPFEPGLLLGYNISNMPDGQGTGGAGAIGMSVVTPNFQWCATIHGTPGVQGAFQSFQRGFADVVNGTSVHAGTVELTADGYVLTTEEDDLSAAPVVWHAFGHPDRVTAWLPHIYRRVLG